MADAVAVTREALPDKAALETEWLGLEALRPGVVFLSWAWVGTWLATLPTDMTPLLLRARVGDETVGLAIGIERVARRGATLPTRGLYLQATGDDTIDTIFVEYNGFLCAERDEPAIMAALLGWFQTQAPDIDALHLPGIVAPLTTKGLLDEVQAEPGFAVDLIAVAAAGGDVASLLGGSSRQQVRRVLRAYEQQGPLCAVEAASTDEALRFFHAMKAMHVASWQRRRRDHAFSDDHFERFHVALIKREFATGVVQLVEIAAGDQPIGYLYNFRRDGMIYAYQSGFDDRDRKLSPGVASHAMAIRLNAEQGARRYDFLAGANRLKQNFATERYTLYWQVLRRPRLDHRLIAAARRVKRRLFP